MMNLTLNEARARGLSDEVILRDSLNGLRILGYDKYCCFDYITRIKSIKVIRNSKFNFEVRVVISHHGETEYTVRVRYNLAVKGYGGNEDIPQLNTFDVESIVNRIKR